MLERDSLGSRHQVSTPFETPRLVALLVCGAIAFVVWIGVVWTVPPQRLLTYLAFFVPMFAFSACFLAALLYWLSSRRDNASPSTLGQSVREGGIMAVVLVVNLAFVSGHRWSLPTLVVTAGLGCVLELIGRYRSAKEGNAGAPRSKSLA